METQYVEVVRSGITDRYAVRGLDEASWSTFFDQILMPLIDGGAELKPLVESEFLGHPMYKTRVFFEADKIGLVVHYMTEWDSETQMQEWLQNVADFQQLHGQAPL